MSDEHIQKLAKLQMEFSLNLYKHFPNIDEGGNVSFSPFSISAVLSMIYMGSRGNTEQEIGQVLNILLLKHDVHNIYREYTRALETKSRNYVLSTANRVYFHQKTHILDSYTADCLKYYNAEPLSVDFETSEEKIRKQINKWVEDRTNEKIKNLIGNERLNARTIMVIVNAVYFKGAWGSKFDPQLTKKEPFNISKTQSVAVDMMLKTKKFKRGTMREIIVASWSYHTAEMNSL